MRGGTAPRTTGRRARQQPDAPRVREGWSTARRAMGRGSLVDAPWRTLIPATESREGMSSSERQSESAGTLASATSDEKCDSTALTTPSSMLGLRKNKGAKRGERSERQSEDRDQRQSESGEPSQRRRIRGCYMGGESERQSAREGSRARRCGACGKCASVSDLPTERRPLRFELFVTLVRRPSTCLADTKDRNARAQNI